MAPRPSSADPGRPWLCFAIFRALLRRRVRKWRRKWHSQLTRTLSVITQERRMVGGREFRRSLRLAPGYVLVVSQSLYVGVIRFYGFLGFRRLGMAFTALHCRGPPTFLLGGFTTVAATRGPLVANLHDGMNCQCGHRNRQSIQVRCRVSMYL